MKNKKSQNRLSTIAVHAGKDRHGVAGPVATPIIQSSNFIFSSTRELKLWAEGRSNAYIYTRYGNPTLAAAESAIAGLEGSESALVTSSGMAAISSALLTILGSGDEVIATQQLYGGSYRLMRDVFPKLGITVRHVEADLHGIESLVTTKTRALYVETPTNPALRLVDLKRSGDFARRHGLVSLVDNTFASPVLQRPTEFGFDLVLHSATKYIAGHSDLIAGAVAGGKKWVDRVRQTVIYLGGSMDPGAAFLLLRGIRTLPLRMRRHCDNAMTVARFLEKHPRVSAVHYPGLSSHPDHALARRQMDGYGGMLSFDLKGGLSAARRFCDRVHLFLLAVSLGGVESLVVLPAYSSHYRMSGAELKKAGISEGTVRMSVGIEDAEDLIEDLRQALR
jgi:methionine-gamma-lyase